MHLKDDWRCTELLCEQSSSSCIYSTATSPPADQQAIGKHQGGLLVHSYTNRSIVMTRGASTERCPSRVTHYTGHNTNHTISHCMKGLDHYVER